MQIRQKLKAGGAKAVSAGMSLVLAVGLMPLPAFAGDLEAASVATQATAMDTTGQVVAAAYAAANPAPEILGLDNPNQRSAKEAETTYNFFGDPAINTNPDPYLYNNHNKLTPGIVIGGRQGSPMSALYTYDSDDATAAQNAVWETQPHIILGTGSDAFPSNDASKERTYYTDDSNKNMGAVPNSDNYKPFAVTYNRTSLPTMIQTMYRLAKAADDKIAADSNLTARYSGKNASKTSGNYETVTEIAKDYERYILGQKGLVLQAINSGKVKEQTVAFVQNYDNGVYTIITDGVAEGTATTNRYIEAVQGVAYNYYNTVGAAGATSVSVGQLKNKVDKIIIGGQASMDVNDLVKQLETDGLIDKTFFCLDWDAGSSFGTTVNSVENAVNVGRILPFVYPSVLDQADMMGYYFETFYHFYTNQVKDIVAKKLNGGVRNAKKHDSKSFTAWTASDLQNYSRSNVQDKLIEGVAYLNSLDQSKLSDYLKPTANLSGDKAKVDLANAKVTVPAMVNGSPNLPTPTVTIGETTLTKNTDYTVSYSKESGLNLGDEVTVTVTAKSDSANYQGSNSAKFTVIAAANVSDEAVTVTLDNPSPEFTGAPIRPAVTVKSGSTTLEQGKDYLVKYENNTNAKASSDTEAPKVTVTGIGAYKGEATKNFTINKLTPKITVNYNRVEGQGQQAKTVVDHAVTNGSATLTYGDSKHNISIELPAGITAQGESSDPSVATHTYDTKKKSWAFSILKVGTTTLTYKVTGTDNVNEATATLKLKTEGMNAAQTVSVSTADKSGKITRTIDITKKFALGASTNGGGELSCTSSDTSVATVAYDSAKKDWVVDIKKPGTTKLTVSAAANEAVAAQAGSTEVTLIVEKQEQKISTDAPASYTKWADDAAFELPAASVIAGSDAKISYSSSNPNVATIDNNTRMVTIKGAGTTNLIIAAAEAEKYKAAQIVIPLTVNLRSQTITCADSFAKTVGDAAFALGAKTDGGGTLSYKSSNAAVAAVDASGNVTVGQAGTATITITAAATKTHAAATKTVTVTVAAAAPAAPAEPAAPEALPTGTKETVTSSDGSTSAVTVTGADTVTLTKLTSSAKTVNVGTVEINGVTYQVAAIGANALKGSKAKTITVGDSVTTLGKGALSNTKKLTKLTLGKGLKKVGKNVLKGSKVKTVTLKSSKLNKKNFTNLFKGSKVKTIKLKGVSKKAKKSYKKWAKALGKKVK